MRVPLWYKCLPKVLGGFSNQRPQIGCLPISSALLALPDPKKPPLESLHASLLRAPDACVWPEDRWNSTVFGWKENQVIRYPTAKQHPGFARSRMQHMHFIMPSFAVFTLVVWTVQKAIDVSVGGRQDSRSAAVPNIDQGGRHRMQQKRCGHKIPFCKNPSMVSGFLLSQVTLAYRYGQQFNPADGEASLTGDVLGELDYARIVPYLLLANMIYTCCRASLTQAPFQSATVAIWLELA